MNKLMSFLIMLMPFVGVAYSQDELRCINFANGMGFSVSPEVKGVLCNGAPTRIAPVTCFKEALQLRPSPGRYNSAVLCSGAENLKKFNPISCYNKVKKQLPSRELKVAYTICSQAKDMKPLDCTLGWRSQKGLRLDWKGAAAFCTNGFVARD